MALHYIATKDLETLKKDISTELAKHQAKHSWIKANWKGNELSVLIEKGGTSEMGIALNANGTNIDIKESLRKIALLHRPFSGEVEKIIDTIMNTVGAKKA